MGVTIRSDQGGDLNPFAPNLTNHVAEDRE
jgi:hypothetical protein